MPIDSKLWPNYQFVQLSNSQTDISIVCADEVLIGDLVMMRDGTHTVIWKTQTIPPGCSTMYVELQFAAGVPLVLLPAGFPVLVWRE